MQFYMQGTPTAGVNTIHSSVQQPGNQLLYTPSAGAQAQAQAQTPTTNRAQPVKTQDSDHFSFLQWSNLLSGEKKKNLQLETELEYARASTRKVEFELFEQRNKCTKCPSMKDEVRQLVGELKDKKSELSSLIKVRKDAEGKAQSFEIKNCELTVGEKWDRRLLESVIAEEGKKREKAEEEFRREEGTLEEAKAQHNKLVKELEQQLREEQKKAISLVKELDLRLSELKDKDKVIESLNASSSNNEYRRNREETQRLLESEREKANTLQKELDEALNGFVNERMQKSETQQALETVLEEKMALQKELCAEQARTLKRETEYEEERERGLQNNM